ncbi:MAG: electron transfer flavoprotein subunit alpha [Candidatus Fluviicola riflensis]|nr:MAG: electron transfer flavoprotein subunit alpha [Candidatus Fluviicola riflensis]OGS77328.1 MAG: electron transfer flavoprotein subunit alpha [Candidatus Fluviicola riflensis]OGS82624.1 MAG: electron transfer flavoprotein subunit alpha [Fluviicola sp. RIFCSPHIGHO2_01_FULL_43_53]OGS83907.1 MAG: electron transfer flavoprotein subunit alpha [Fluviicola sp. RIFCSPHIGHO2_12_FULL_43_24]
MNILVYINTAGNLAKSALEAVTYASKIGGSVSVVATGTTDDATLATLGEYGAQKVMVDRSASADDAQQITRLVAKAAEAVSADVIVFSHDLVAKAVAPRLSVRLKAGYISGAVAVPDVSNGFSCKVNVFSGKAYAQVAVNTSKKIISLLPNSIQPEKAGAACAVEAFDGAVGTAAIKVVDTKKPEGEIPLPEAEIVVSAGRGLKGPENWGMVEDLAEALGAATACSRPVADIGWRPHHEHVGQTGVAIRPNLYIAAGISGAIQHLAGVNGSKVIVVINTDAEAPFFKAADYGVVGDVFEVLPKLTAAVKKFRAAQ